MDSIHTASTPKLWARIGRGPVLLDFARKSIRVRVHKQQFYESLFIRDITRLVRNIAVNKATYDLIMGLLGDLGHVQKCLKLVSEERSFWGASLYNNQGVAGFCSACFCM